MPEVAYIFGAILTALGLFITILWVVFWRRALRSLYWPQTNGVVLTSTLIEGYGAKGVFVPPTPNVKNRPRAVDMAPKM